MNSFGNDFMTSLYVWDQDSNIVFNTYIKYDKYSILIKRRILINVIEFVLMSNSCIGIFSVHWIKRTIRESVYNMKTVMYYKLKTLGLARRKNLV